MQMIKMSKDSSSNPFNMLIGALMIIIVGLSFGCNSTAPPQPVSGAPTRTAGGGRPAVNEKAISEAFDVPLARLDGASFKLADFKGKVVVVDFWATYCPPCVKQIPQLAELSKRHRDKGLEIIGLTSDEKSDQDKVEQFIKRLGVNYTVGYANNWVSGAFLKGTEDESGAPPIPQLFVIARDGRVVEHLIGDSPDHGLPYLEKVVTRELSSNATSQ
jgi:cytochrome c biogenesis protein CcmG/thiol:disulfide interchange protein DsbE